MEQDEQALNSLINEAMETEKALVKREGELALQSKQFADYLAEKKHNDEKLEVLWDMVREYMTEHNITKHETPYILLTLSPSGKFRAKEGVETADLPDEICKVVKSLDNKKVKAYLELNGALPEGVEPTGMVLRKKVKTDGQEGA